MRKIKKKILSIVLTCAMMVSLLVGVSPMEVSAIEMDEITITKQPEDVTVEMGDRATFTVEAESKLGLALSYQWEVDYGEGFRNAYGSGQTSATYTTYSTDASFVGSKYRCVITTERGSVTSDEVTLTINIQRPTEATGVSIQKTVDGYTVTGIEEEDGYRWGYYPYKLDDGEDLDEAIEEKLNEHLTEGPWGHELANSFNGSYEITSYTFPGRDPESLDNYDYIEIVKLDESWMIREVVVLPLPKTIAPTYPSGDEIVDLGDDSITIDEDNILHYDIPEDRGEYLYLTMVIPTMYLGDVMSADEYIEMLEKGIGEAVVDVPGTLSMDNVSYNTNLQNDMMTIYIMSDKMWESSEEISEEITLESVVCLIKFHKDNFINATYDSYDENDYFKGLSDKAYIYAVYGVHAELVTPTGTGGSSGDGFIDEVDVQVDWNKVPSLIKGMTEIPMIEGIPGTSTVDGAKPLGASWAVKVDETYKITPEDSYYNELKEMEGESFIEYYNSQIDYYIEVYSGMLPLDEAFSNPFYEINEEDTYAMFFVFMADVGKNFGGSRGEAYEGELTSNLDIVCHFVDGSDAERLVVFFELGTLAEMEEEKNEASGSTEVTYDITLDRTNYTDGWVLLLTYDDEGANVEETEINNGTITMPEGGKVRVFADSEFTVKAEGATVSEMKNAGEEGYYYEITGIKADTTVVVSLSQKEPDTDEDDSEKDDSEKEDGTFDKDAAVTPDAPIDDVTLDNSKDELLDAENIFNETEKQQIKDGADAKVWLEISKSEADDITADDKAEIEREVAKIMGDKLNLTYFNADLFKQVGNGPATPVSKPGIAIKVTIVIPEDLLNSDTSVERVYKIVRLHDGKVDVLSGDFNAETGEFTFETDRFSPYAIAYVDSPIENGGTVESPDAGDCNRTVALIMFMAISGALAFVCVRRKVTINDEI